ncbi:NAD(P)/FAD-dependent oxidoreductase [Sphingosinicella sp. CPCC 101087]|uniref:flavin monoamine oxidase family protein n=1 Tax=Sphingosinicella sp. CPCC 101087 TaxID=2497754 RepID=UPI00101B7D3C|nr:NAD(P)/FAD-dependent oxidoreductase [Sphingosinicella sp. CPCC 101087]
MAAELDVIIIGAGAAGIAAGRRLAREPLSFLIVEAGDRIGGRAWTLERAGLPLDLGCGWLHSADRNPWLQLAERLGFAVDRRPPDWGRQYADLGFPPEEQSAAAAASEAFERRRREAPPVSDCAADALEPASPWNAYLETRSFYISGASLSSISVRDEQAYDAADSGTNWRIPAGYGTLISSAASGLPIALDCSVERVDRAGARLALHTPQGTLSARAAIVTVGTAVLAAERLRFDPPLDAKTEAAERLPLGLANKMFLALDGAGEIEPDRHLIGNPHRAETGSYYLRPFGRPVIEAFFGGPHARALEAEGEAGAAEFAMEELAALFGSGFRARLRPLVGSAWGAAGHFGGSYSHALPGHSAARRQLAAPVENRLFFAGEACSRHVFSTAHGACLTGVRAAEQALVALACA